MSLGSWAKKHLSVHLDSHTLGNLVKNGAPLAAFTPAGVLGAGLLGGLGELGRGKNIGEAAKAGLSSAAQGAGATSVAGHFGVGPGTHLGLGIGGGGAPAPVAGGPPPVMSQGGLALPNSAIPTGAAIPGGSFTGPQSMVTRALDAGKGLAGWAEHHPTTTAAALQGLGDLSTSGSKNRIADAQADVLEQQAGETAYDFDRRKRRDEALAPIWSSLGQTAGSSYANVAKNPYAVGG